MNGIVTEGDEMNTVTTINSLNNCGGNSQVVQNQLHPNMMQLNNLRNALRSKEQFIHCPYCKKGGMTRVEAKISFKSVLSCFATAGIPWAIVQWIRGKDINCFDAKHKCAKCNHIIADYSSC